MFTGSMLKYLSLHNVCCIFLQFRQFEVYRLYFHCHPPRSSIQHNELGYFHNGASQQFKYYTQKSDHGTCCKWTALWTGSGRIVQHKVPVYWQPYYDWCNAFCCNITCFHAFSIVLISRRRLCILYYFFDNHVVGTTFMFWYTVKHYHASYFFLWDTMTSNWIIDSAYNVSNVVSSLIFCVYYYS